jgi:hypothetical protein
VGVRVNQEDLERNTELHQAHDAVVVRLAQAQAPSDCKNIRQANGLTTADGVSHDIIGPERDVLVEDAINMDAEQFQAKWAHLTVEFHLHALKQRGLISDGTEENK